MRSVLLFGFVLLPATPLAAHGGRLNAEGCHKDRGGGTGYHCHGGGTLDPKAKPQFVLSACGSGGTFANCTAARNAGAAPARRGDPGYSAKLERDGDGVGCE